MQIHPLQNNIHVSKVHCGSVFESGASGIHYYYTPPPVRVLDIIGGLRLAVWQHNNKNKTKISGGRWRISQFWGPNKCFHYSGPSPMRPNELWTHPDTEPPGLAPGCQQRQLLGPVEEEEEGISIVSDVVKVQGEDPATPGCLRSVDHGTSKPRDHNDSPILVQ